MIGCPVRIIIGGHFHEFSECVNLCIEIVNHVDYYRLKCLRPFGRSVLKHAVMTEQNVPEFQGKRFWKVFNHVNFGINQFDSQYNMTDQPSLVGIIDELFERQFVNLSYVVQDTAREHKIPVKIGVVRSRGTQKACDGQCMFQKAVDIGMMKPFCRRRPFEQIRKLFVTQFNDNVTLLTNAYVDRLETDSTGRAVQSVVTQLGDGSTVRFSADVVVVACGAVNTAALLLRSANGAHPTGLAPSADRQWQSRMSIAHPDAGRGAQKILTTATETWRIIDEE